MMDCNKEEALRAKAIAEKKLESKDFLGARKFALKAQKLYSDLDNISQLLCVCDVHCSAENKMLGNEKDWYGILQVEQTADEISIKKQYRKFALLLHPDKNKLSGAEAAFKLIGEAQGILLDKDRRAFHDMKRRTCRLVVPTHATQPTHAPQQGSGNTNAGSIPKVNVSGNASADVRNTKPTSQPPLQPQSVAPNGKETFWTLCPFCAVRYQYYKEVLNRALRCQSCKKPFIAYDMCAQGVPRGANAAQNPGVKPEIPAQATGKSQAADRSHGQNQQNSIKEPFPKARQDSNVGPQKTSDAHKATPEVDKPGTSAGLKSSRKVNGKRSKKQVVESSESLGSSSTDMEEDIAVDEHGEINSNSIPVGVDSERRRSSRSKQHVSYGEFVSDDDDALNPSKRAKASMDENSEGTPKEMPSAPAKSSDERDAVADFRPENAEGEDDVQRNSKADHDECTSNLSAEAASETELHDVPDPDFHDFDIDRKQECFKIGQLWAVYDTVDAMPRFYARIRKVFSPGFKVKITWLEPDPVDKDEIEWVDRDLPFSCGKFKSGESDVTMDHLMFSHIMPWEKGSGRLSFKIHPRKGETWALFKDWDIKWDNVKIDSDSVSERKYEFDFVEVLSEYDGAHGVRVAYLAKLKGFTCVFVRKLENEAQIPPRELLRFSHRVPSFKLTGEEREDVPRGSLELDPAAISTNLEEVSVPEEVAVKDKGIHCNGSSSKSPRLNDIVEEVEEIAPPSPHVPKIIDLEDSVDGDAANGSSYQEEYELPEPEFFDFDGLRTLDKFQAGQVWALYSDEDGLPKYYALIKKVDLSSSRYKLTIQWLEACLPPSDSELPQSKRMPVCCGRFRMQITQPGHYADSSSFSHRLNAEPTSKRNTFSIYPRKGEVWAIYKGEKPPVSNSEKCDYDIVEILDRDTSHVKVLFLERVAGFGAVFKPRKIGESLRIPINDVLRFSHQIPCFRLTSEKGGSLNDLMELDPAALPPHMFRPS